MKIGFVRWMLRGFSSYFKECYRVGKYVLISGGIWILMAIIGLFLPIYTFFTLCMLGGILFALSIFYQYYRDMEG